MSGERIGNYRIETELSCDGYGVQYRAVHQVLPRRALIKILHGTSATQPRVVSMLREACILDALHHPGILRVYESGLTADRRPWFASELIEGPSLASVMVPGALPRVELVGLLRDLVGALEHAHDRGVIHGGVRPSRVVLTGRQRGYPLCITDWSDARAHDATPVPYPVTPESWHYTAPELAAGDTVDDRADVFALGVIAYQMLTGVVPYENRVVATASDGSTQHVPTALRAPDAPRELTTLVDQMLAYDRWDRPSSAEVHDGLGWVVDAMIEHVRTTSARIRRPRWTPPLQFNDPPTALERLEQRERAPTLRDED